MKGKGPWLVLGVLIVAAVAAGWYWLTHGD